MSVFCPAPMPPDTRPDPGLQASKAALASAVLGEGKAAGPALTAEDIKALFEPLG